MSEDSKKAIPSRPVVSGTTTYNVHLSELLSDFLEPMAREMTGAEIASTEDALNETEQVDKWITDELEEFNLQKTKNKVDKTRI